MRNRLILKDFFFTFIGANTSET